MNAVSAQDLTKSYDGKTLAVDHLTLEVPQGMVFGFLGPNGAGKTTAVKLFTGLLSPTEGSCAVFGFSAGDAPEKIHRLCGVMTESARMYRHMTGMENLVFFARTFGIKPELCAGRAGELLKQLDLWDARDKKLGAYSTGMAQRLSLARALIHQPRVLFLDEPTSGLDPESAQAVNEIIAELARDTGTTIFLCTHQLRYAQDLCGAYGILDHGKLLARGTLQELCNAIGYRIRAGFRMAEGETPEGLQWKDGWWQTEIRSEEEMPRLLKRVAESGHAVYEARLIRPTLEDVYFRYVEGQEVPE